MITFTNTVRIGRPAADVYDYLADLRHVPEWNWAIAETTPTTPDPIRVGSRYRQTRTAPRPGTDTLEITALTRNRHVAIEGTLANLPVRLSYDLAETADGTDVTNTITLDPPGALQLAGPLLQPTVKRAVAGNLGELKKRLERP